MPAKSGPRAPTSMLQGFTEDGADAGLWLCEEGERIGLLFVEWLKRIVVRRGDRSTIFTLHRRSALTTSGRLRGGVTGAVQRDGRDYLAGEMRFRPASNGILAGTGGEIIVFDLPVDGELIRLKFTPAATPQVRAEMLAIALLLEHDYRR